MISLCKVLPCHNQKPHSTQRFFGLDGEFNDISITFCIHNIFISPQLVTRLQISGDYL